MGTPTDTVSMASKSFSDVCLTNIVISNWLQIPSGKALAARGRLTRTRANSSALVNIRTGPRILIFTRLPDSVLVFLQGRICTRVHSNDECKDSNLCTDP